MLLLCSWFHSSSHVTVAHIHTLGSGVGGYGTRIDSALPSSTTYHLAWSPSFSVTQPASIGQRAAVQDPDRTGIIGSAFVHIPPLVSEHPGPSLMLLRARFDSWRSPRDLRN